MTQAAIVIPNSTGLVFRNNINAALEAIATDFMGPAAPSVTYAGQTWIDTSTGTDVRKFRNRTNTAWVTSSTVDQVARDAAAAASASAALRVLKAGDTVTGSLNFATNLERAIVANASDVNGTYKFAMTSLGPYFGWANGLASTDPSFQWYLRAYDPAGTGSDPEVQALGILKAVGPLAGIGWNDQTTIRPWRIYARDDVTHFRVQNSDVFSATSARVVTFAFRPVFGVATPWDSANLTFPGTTTTFLRGDKTFVAVPNPTAPPGGTTAFYRADGTWAVPPGTGGTGGAVAWGAISGTISAQTDLNTALTARALDTAVVHKTLNETIAGFKTYTQQIISTYSEALRLRHTSRSLLFYFDGNQLDFLHTAAADPDGAYSINRPFSLNLPGNYITMFGTGFAVNQLYGLIATSYRALFGTPAAGFGFSQLALNTGTLGTSAELLEFQVGAKRLYQFNVMTDRALQLMAYDDNGTTGRQIIRIVRDGSGIETSGILTSAGGVVSGNGFFGAAAASAFVAITTFGESDINFHTKGVFNPRTGYIDKDGDLFVRDLTASRGTVEGAVMFGDQSAGPLSIVANATAYTFTTKPVVAPSYQVVNAVGDEITAQPRIFVQALDPDTKAGEGDLWIWTNIKRRQSNAWVAVTL